MGRENPKYGVLELVICYVKEGYCLIYVVRHGQTDINREGKLQGRRGLPLNDVGVEQANY